MNRGPTFLLGLLLGSIGTWFVLSILTVPPPPFTGASFGNNAPPRTVADKKVKVYYWSVPASVPTGANRNDPTTWGSAPYGELRTSNGYYHALNFPSQNVITVAVVVEATNDGTTETYINFAPDTPLPTPMAIGSVVASLEPAMAGAPGLQARFFFGAGRSPDMQALDVTYFVK